MQDTEKFADESDRASALESAALESNVLAARQKANKLDFEPTGFCLNCDEPLEEGKRFCDKNCLDDHAKRNRKYRK